MNEWREQTVGLRRFYWLAVVLVVSVGVFTFVLSNDTARLFAWPIKPSLTAAFLGANYWAAFFLAFFSARERIWVRARITYAVSLVFTSLTLLATLIHLDKFSFGNANGWLWLIVYVTVPPTLLFLLPRQLRKPGVDPPRSAPIERWLLPIVAVQGIVVLVIGVAFWIHPSSAGSLWPWTLTPLTARAVGAWLLALATGLAMTLWERDWIRIRVATPTYVAAAVFQFVAIARFSNTVSWHAGGVWVYLAFLASILLLGAFGISRGWVRREEELPVAAAHLS